MIVVTVGTQLPFDRLIRAIDGISADLAEPVIAQIGTGGYEPRNMRWERLFDPQAFDEMAGQARLLVAHAGIGTVLTAQRQKKPIVLFPRRLDMGEHRNNHQIATVRALEGRSGIHVAYTEEELEALVRGNPAGPDDAPAYPARDRLIAALADHIGS